MWHPAALLLAWVCFALALQLLSLLPVLLLAVLCLFMAGLVAPRRIWWMFLRVRWLLLVLLTILFFMTPGTYLPGIFGDIGLTNEGVLLAGEQIGRLFALLASLSLLHEHLGSRGFLEGLYSLMGTSSWSEKTVVRLILVLEFAEQGRSVRWRDWLEEGRDYSDQNETFQLQRIPMGWHDQLLIAGVLIFCALMVAYS